MPMRISLNSNLCSFKASAWTISKSLAPIDPGPEQAKYRTEYIPLCILYVHTKLSLNQFCCHAFNKYYLANFALFSVRSKKIGSITLCQAKFKSMAFPCNLDTEPETLPKGNFQRNKTLR